MSSFSVCPGCGLPGTRVKTESVAAFSGRRNLSGKNKKEKWNACLQSDCPIAYYGSDGKTIETEKLKRPLWYKNPQDGNDIICYCAKITRQDIESAVKEGCKSVKDVRKHSGKDKKGSCSKTHPLGKCCKNAFQYLVEKLQ